MKQKSGLVSRFSVSSCFNLSTASITSSRWHKADYWNSASSFSDEGGKLGKINRPGPALDHLTGVLAIDQFGDQPGEFLIQQQTYRSIFNGQMIVLVDAAPASQKPVEIWITLPQEFQHVEHKHLACRKPTAHQPVQIVHFQPLGRKVPDPFLAVTTVRRLKVSTGYGTSDFLFGHRQLRRVRLRRMIAENHRRGNTLT
jgi:hypothetical protein